LNETVNIKNNIRTIIKEAKKNNKPLKEAIEDIKFWQTEVPIDNKELHAYINDSLTQLNEKMESDISATTKILEEKKISLEELQAKYKVAENTIKDLTERYNKAKTIIESGKLEDLKVLTENTSKIQEDINHLLTERKIMLSDIKIFTEDTTAMKSDLGVLLKERKDMLSDMKVYDKACRKAEKHILFIEKLLEDDYGYTFEDEPDDETQVVKAEDMDDSDVVVDGDHYTPVEESKKNKKKVKEDADQTDIQDHPGDQVNGEDDEYDFTGTADNKPMEDTDIMGTAMSETEDMEKYDNGDVIPGVNKAKDNIDATRDEDTMTDGSYDVADEIYSLSSARSDIEKYQDPETYIQEDADDDKMAAVRAGKSPKDDKDDDDDDEDDDDKDSKKDDDDKKKDENIKRINKNKVQETAKPKIKVIPAVAQLYEEAVRKNKSLADVKRQIFESKSIMEAVGKIQKFTEVRKNDTMTVRNTPSKGDGTVKYVFKR